LNPLVDGVRFRVDDLNGVPIFSRFIPGSANWTQNHSGRRWTFKDAVGLIAPGIYKIVVSDKSSTAPGLYSFKITGKNSDFQVLFGEVPVQMTVTLGTAMNQCGSRVFNPSTGVAPACKLSSSLATLNCR
jgi:hypothetical protein